MIYDLSQPKNSRIISAKVLCASCNIPTYSKLEKNQSYNVLLTDFMQSGGDGYSMLKNLQTQPLGIFIYKSCQIKFFNIIFFLLFAIS